MADLQRKTANLFDMSNTDLIFTGTTLAVDNEWNGGGGISKVIRIPCEPLTTYTISGESESSIFRISLSELETAPNPVSGSIKCIDVLKASSVSTQTFTTTANTKYILVQVGASAFDDYINVLMLNKGGTALPYEPYGWVHSLRKLTTATDTFTTLPVDIYADGNNATVGISGNTIQSGTPTPDNPVMPNGTGERTAQLFDKSTAVAGYGVDNNSGNLFRSAALSASDYINISGESYIRATYITSGVANQYGAFYDENKTYISGYSGYSNVIAVPQNAVYTRITARTEYIDEFMFNLGSTPLPYEPYGYKIPISSAGQTTPVYLGEVQTTRRVRKFVLTGDENWTLSTAWKGTNTSVFYTTVSGANNQDNDMRYVVSDHFISASRNEVNSGDTDMIGLSSRNALTVRISDNIATTLTEFQTYLSTQYTNGTPVTVWYVLTTPATGIVNEPLMKIGDYADTVSDITVPTITGKDTFDVETTLKPSESSLSYTGWHDATVEEWDGSQWNE